MESQSSTWVASLVTIVTLARFGHGLFVSITGPTLLFLAQNTNSEVSQVSAMFTGRSGGILFGAMLFSYIMNKFPKHKPLMSLGLIFAINGVVMLVTPWCHTLWVLIVMTTIGGVSFGYDDSGLQALYLKLFGEERSRPYIQSIHFGFSVGAFLAPVIAAPFLEKAGDESNSDSSCPNNVASTTIGYVLYSDTPVVNATDNNEIDGVNPVSWPFVIIGVYILIMSAALCILAFLGVEDRLQSADDKTTESRDEEPLRQVYLLFIFVVLWYYFLETSEVVFQSFIYSVARCSDLQFTVTQAARINSLFWAGFGIGRAVAIVHSRYITPTTILTIDIIATSIGMIIVSIWGEQNPGVMWTIAFTHGLFVATLYSSGISWTSQVTNVSGSYIFIFTLGNATAGMIMLPVGGIIFEDDPFNVIYIILGSCLATGFFFIILLRIASLRQKNIVTSQKSEVVTKFTNKTFEQ